MAKAKYSASMEDYLEAIYNVIAEKKAVRVKDIAKRLGVINASVSGALRHLLELNLINYAPYDVISLTATGEKTALDVIKRHDALQDFFVNILGIKQQEAEAEACKVEHSISANVLGRLVKFMEFSLNEKTCMQKNIIEFQKKLGN
jgi:DtxR family Mn-dependent transcriptional regulator